MIICNLYSFFFVSCTFLRGNSVSVGYDYVYIYTFLLTPTAVCIALILTIFFNQLGQLGISCRIWHSGWPSNFSGINLWSPKAEISSGTIQRIRIRVVCAIVSPYFRRAKICSKFALDVVSRFGAYYRARVWPGPARIEKRGESLRRNSQVQRSIYEVQS